ncbi:MAG: alpha/beta family hydrolase [Acidimicrobiales bacterium]|nr:dienelactone hydrolase [Actinomycetota bacterium]
MAPRRRPAGLLLTPGAGSDASHHTLVAIEEALAPLAVRRVDFPYRKEGRRAPDRAPKLIASVRADAEEFGRSRRARTGRIVLGGRSMGGRMCSMAVAEGLPAAGLVLISYPLHPPGKPDRLRVEHLPLLEVPCLFVTGTRDPFGTPEELQSATATIPGPVTHVWIEGGRHDLKGADPQIAAAVRAWIDALPDPPPTLS